MRKSDRWIAETAAEVVARDPGTKVLVAVEGFFEPGRECIPGELLIPSPPCWRPSCTCEDGFHGVGSHGNASLARVRRLRGVPRALAQAEIAAAMGLHDEFDAPDRSAASFLDEVGGIEEGRLVRRDTHVLLPFPRAAEIIGAHTVRYRLDDEP